MRAREAYLCAHHDSRRWPPHRFRPARISPATAAGSLLPRTGEGPGVGAARRPRAACHASMRQRVRRYRVLTSRSRLPDAGGSSPRLRIRSPLKGAEPHLPRVLPVPRHPRKRNIRHRAGSDAARACSSSVRRMTPGVETPDDEGAKPAERRSASGGRRSGATCAVRTTRLHHARIWNLLQQVCPLVARAFSPGRRRATFIP